MTHNFPVPDEARLEHLINRMFVKLPVPEIIRLNRIEERLSRQLAINRPKYPVNKIPWWIVLLLTGGIATAAWWAGDLYDSIRVHDKQTMNMNDDDTQHADTPASPELEQDQQVRDDVQPEASDRLESPIIYQREQ